MKRQRPRAHLPTEQQPLRAPLGFAPAPPRRKRRGGRQGSSQELLRDALRFARVPQKRKGRGAHRRSSQELLRAGLRFARVPPKDQSPCLTPIRHVARILRHALENGSSVDIDGLGTFLPGHKQGFRFVAQDKPRVFIAYVEEDLSAATKLYLAFEQHGFRPWLDKKNLMAGQNWPRAIETAIQTSDFFVACFSRRSTTKRGSFHSELRYALACAARVPLDEIFFIPIRLEDCILPRRISGKIQYVDLFPGWDAGLKRVLHVMRRQETSRKRKKLPIAG